MHNTPTVTEQLAIDHGLTVDEYRRILHALGRTPTDDELSAASGLTRAELNQVRGGQDRAALLSLDSFTPDGEGLAATVKDTAPNPEEALIAAALAAHGQSRVSPLETVERGYSRLLERLQLLGGQVAKID